MIESLSTAEFARRYKIGIHKALVLIARGEVAAVNVSLSSRPQWRIPPAAIEDFERRRAAQSKPAPKQKRKTHAYKYF
jgi:hypothetical protein